ncbi:unnamed protein product [Bursaphelenchus okinawaensis]|uniref:Uncharacterized protein n=1 Tax=Bursaphelenchus okinawaensis TaxID=465554 RepID=A0A811KWG8_9BILA|nr:unnamed protein product [Bursaphelenchus okinawaensis]CAG9113282.1 unnamed protein product [Bursaphelenchus okinawaensis]
MSAPLIVRDWQKDCVYLVQFPRAGCIPSISSYCLKMETWLRIAEIPYQNVDSQFKYKSERGQLPFVELNGRQICDTNYIIAELSRMFHVQLDDQLNEKERSEFVAIEALIEDSLSWSVNYYRSLNLSFLSTDDGLLAHFSGFRKLMFRTFLVNRLKRNYRQRCKAQGIGRQLPSDVMEATIRKLKAISVFLGDKKYIMGDKVTSLDATAFGHLCMFYYCPLNKDIKNYMETDCRNIIDYLRNVKEEFWSDWNECTAKLSLATKPRQMMPLNGVYPSNERLKIPDMGDREMTDMSRTNESFEDLERSIK